MTGSAFVPNVTTFAVFRFFCGLCAEAIFAIAFTWGNFTDSNFQTSQFHIRMKYLPTKCCVRALSFRFSTKRVQKKKKHHGAINFHTNLMKLQNNPLYIVFLCPFP